MRGAEYSGYSVGYLEDKIVVPKNATAKKRRSRDRTPQQPIPKFGCPAILAKRKVNSDGSVTGIAMLNATASTYITRFHDDMQYTHMAMVENVPMGDGKNRLVAAWQGAPKAPAFINSQTGDMYQPMATEGLPTQRIFWATSDDGGASWTEAQAIPADHDALDSSYWSPVLYYDKSRELLWIFYAVSKVCRKVVHGTSLWEPGGDIRARVLKVGGGVGKYVKFGVHPLLTWVWGSPRTILRQQTDNIPKVIANKPVVLETGEWVIPFWREQPSSENGGTCAQEEPLLRYSSSAHMYQAIANRTSAGVLISKDDGFTWRPYGRIRETRTNLIEGSLVEVGDELHMYFRAIVGCVFRSVSSDRGQTWSKPELIPISNPNTKFSVISVKPTEALEGVDRKNPLLLMAFNNHKRGQQGCQQCRTHLHIAASLSRGNTWQQIGVIESEFLEGVRIHYPTLLQSGNKLHLIYSRFYLGTYNMEECKMEGSIECLGLYSPEQGIKFLTFDLDTLGTIPQLFSDEEQEKQLDVNLTESLLSVIIDQKLEEVKGLDYENKFRKLHGFRDFPWDKIVNMLMTNFALDNLGGAHTIRKSMHLYAAFKRILTEKYQKFLNFKITEGQAPCGCHVHNPNNGITHACSCVCRENVDCILLCFLNMANCSKIPGRHRKQIRYDKDGVRKVVKLYKPKGKSVAGMTDEEIAALEAAGEQEEASERKRLY